MFCLPLDCIDRTLASTDDIHTVWWTEYVQVKKNAHTHTESDEVTKRMKKSLLDVTFSQSVLIVSLVSNIPKFPRKTPTQHTLVEEEKKRHTHRKKRKNGIFEQKAKNGIEGDRTEKRVSDVQTENIHFNPFLSWSSSFAIPFVVPFTISFCSDHACVCPVHKTLYNYCQTQFGPRFSSLFARYYVYFQFLFTILWVSFSLFSSVFP